MQVAVRAWVVRTAVDRLFVRTTNSDPKGMEVEVANGPSILGIAAKLYKYI